MKNKEKFIKICDLSVSKVLLDFVNKELLPGTGISKNRFWKGFNKTIHYLSPKNKILIEELNDLRNVAIDEGIYESDDGEY